MSGDVGLAISSSMVLTGMLQLGVRQSAEVASNMTSVERVLQYTKLDNEEDLNPTPRKIPDSKWPHSGRITFKNTFLWYSKAESPVLKNLNITIEAGEKVHNIFLYSFHAWSAITRIIFTQVNHSVVKIVPTAFAIHLVAFFI